MITDKEKERINWHLNLPVCRILRGIKLHVANMSFVDSGLLCRYFNCSYSELIEIFWSVKNKKQEVWVERPFFYEREIQLTQGMVAIVDAADYDWLIKYKWYAHKSRGGYYAETRIGPRSENRKIRMHVLIMNPAPGMEVHHRNTNTLDNRRCNLEECTKKKNLSYRNHNGKKKTRKKVG